jgi:hypothetical protein
MYDKENLFIANLKKKISKILKFICIIFVFILKFLIVYRSTMVLNN